MALPLASYGLDKLYLFPFYGSRERYEQAFGVAPPTFDPKKPPKFWFDPKAKGSGRRSIVYNNVLALGAQGQPLLDENGKMYFEPLVLTVQDASAVNIPEMKAANEEGSGQIPIPVPLRDLEPDEELFLDKANNPGVKNKKLYAIESEKNVFSLSDRELLKAIGRKLGVPVSE